MALNRWFITNRDDTDPDSEVVRALDRSSLTAGFEFQNSIFELWVTKVQVYQNVQGDQTLDEYADELALINDLKHPRLTQVEEIRESDTGFAIFYANYADTLKGTISNLEMKFTENIEKCSQTGLDEVSAAFYFRQVLEIIKYCHEEKVSIGANIQLDNCVFDTKRYGPEVTWTENIV